MKDPWGWKVPEAIQAFLDPTQLTRKLCEWDFMDRKLIQVQN